MNTTLKDSAETYFESFCLTTKQIHQLDLLEKEYLLRTSKASYLKKFVWPLAALVAGVFLVIYFKPVTTDELNPDGIASEIAYNHNKTLSPEFKGKSIHEISPYFSKLEFKLVNSTHNKIPNLKLIGGRYCSINKRLAAHLSLVGANKKGTLSWYQLPLPENQKGLNKDVEIYRNGVKVIMWTEKGVLHGLAGND